jgi:hypothetical protein
MSTKQLRQSPATMRLRLMGRTLLTDAMVCPAKEMISARRATASLISRHPSSTQHTCAQTPNIAPSATTQSSSTSTIRMRNSSSLGARTSAPAWSATGPPIARKDMCVLTHPMKLSQFVIMILTSGSATSPLRSSLEKPMRISQSP